MMDDVFFVGESQKTEMDLRESRKPQEYFKQVPVG